VRQQRGDNALAVQQYRRIVELRPDFFSAWLNLGVRWSSSSSFRRPLKATGGRSLWILRTAMFQFYLALAYLKNRDEFGASAELEKLAKADPKDLRVAICFGDCYLQLGEYDRGLTLLAPLARRPG